MGRKQGAERGSSSKGQHPTSRCDLRVRWVSSDHSYLKGGVARTGKLKESKGGRLGYGEESGGWGVGRDLKEKNRGSSQGTQTVGCRHHRHCASEKERDLAVPLSHQMTTELSTSRPGGIRAGPETKPLSSPETSEGSSGPRVLGEASILPHLQRSCCRPGTPSCHRESKSSSP